MKVLIFFEEPFYKLSSWNGPQYSFWSLISTFYFPEWFSALSLNFSLLLLCPLGDFFFLLFVFELPYEQYKSLPVLFWKWSIVSINTVKTVEMSDS